MALIPVESYSAEWKYTQSTGIVYIKLYNHPMQPIDCNSIEQFMAFLLMLAKPGVHFDNVQKDFQIPPRPAGTP